MKSLPVIWATGITEDLIAAKDGFMTVKEGTAPGSAEWKVFAATEQNAEARHFNYSCPCGCGTLGGFEVSRGSQTPNTWAWDGDLANPTLNPSIQMLCTCRWHGYMTNGVWTPV